jgi:hypothetical protein
MDADTILAAAEPVDRWKRDRWGRPLVLPPDGGTPVPYGRPSGFGIVLEDRFGLNKWQTRMACLGLAQRADLLAQFAAASDDRARDALINQAQEAAGASSGANMGSALHSFTEALDLGRDITVPAPWDADVQAYSQALADHGIVIDPAMIELDVVCDDLALAGTADRYVMWQGRRVVADLKTGKKIADPALGYSVQLAVYARSFLYHHDTGARTDLECCHDVGLIIHLPAGQARCDIYEVDLRAAWDLAHLAAQVKQAQKRKGVVVKSSPGASAVPPPASTDAPGEPLTQALRAELVAALKRADAPALERIAAAWPPGVPTFKQSQDHSRDELRAIQRVIVDVCGLDPQHDVVVPTAADLVARLRNLPADLLAAVEATAKAEGCPNLRTDGIEARWLMRVDALAREAEHEHAARVQEVEEALADLDDDLASDLLRHVTGGLVPVEQLQALAAEQVVCLAAAATWLLDPDLSVNPQAWAELVDRKGGKKSVLDDARLIAMRHGLTPPRSSDITDAVLAALVAGA